MPIEPCQRNNESGWKCGGSGYCYLPSEEGDEQAAKDAAQRQCDAIHAKEEENSLYLPCALCEHPVFAPCGCGDVICPFCRGRQQETDRAREYSA